MLLTLQAIVFFALIAIGVHFKGVSIGLFGGLGVLVFVVIFGLAPGDVPVSAILVILTIVTAAGAMQLAGGLDCLVSIGERMIRKSPGKVTYIAPLATYFLCAGAGTGNVCSLLPVIYEVSYSAGVRPERPLALSATADQMAAGLFADGGFGKYRAGHYVDDLQIGRQRLPALRVLPGQDRSR